MILRLNLEGSVFIDNRAGKYQRTKISHGIVFRSYGRELETKEF